jgi:hypothetical protein
MTEREIQLAFVRRAGNGRNMLPNANVPCVGEADLLRVTPGGYLVEWEIKTSRADFLRDFKHKWYKHRHLSGEWPMGRMGIIPRQFWFIAPEKAVPVVPCYAGLIWVSENGDGELAFQEVVRAPMLPTRKCTPKEIRQFLGQACHRLWGARNEAQQLRLTHTAHQELIA